MYPYECHMKNLSSPTELQAAIDGNRREGRRAGYESYNMFPGPRPHIPLPPSSLPLPQISPLPPGFRPSFNGTGFPGNILSKSHKLHITENQLLKKVIRVTVNVKYDLSQLYLQCNNSIKLFVDTATNFLWL